MLQCEAYEALPPSQNKVLNATALRQQLLTLTTWHH
eukprot:CAMPEP_0172724000 /NCGR_PEP_ID=MMETSP1074-20121228/84949_1 /TAXON_ID=2916 /ORGANISM="Ceratium fusus, Strain PA161109" /LENGTH=35 /DNA_ID= /DNA_START= /DNA_END= /DNA_ORIENTATION=